MKTPGRAFRRPAHRSASLLMVLLLVVPGAQAGPLWKDNSVTFLYGQGYKVSPDDGAIVTLEHASAWNWGDLFAFVDIAEFDNDHTDTYAEIKPRLSIGRMLGRDLTRGPVSDVLLAAEWHKGEGDVEAYNVGIGFDLDVPGARYFTLNVYSRNDRHIGGHTVLVNSAWAFPFEVGDWKFLIDGFVDWMDNEGSSHANLLFVPQVKLDVGNFFGRPGRYYAGVEYSHWDHKFGIEDSSALDSDERVVQALIRAHW